MTSKPSTRDGYDRAWTARVRTTCLYISGARASRTIPVCGPGAFTVLKALAFGDRTENKDAYDLFYVWRGVGVEPAGGRRRLRRPATPLLGATMTVALAELSQPR